MRFFLDICGNLFCFESESEKGENIMRKIIFILCLVFMCNCCLEARRKKNPRPDWVDNPSAEYNSLQYLSAVGFGSSRSVAEDIARANLARIFESRISSESGYDAHYSETISSSDAIFSNQTDQTAQVRVLSSLTLSNVQIGKSWTDDLGQVYAVAYLHRSSTAELYHSKIQNNSRGIMAYLARSLEEEGQWEKYALLSAADELNRENQGLISQLRIISSNEAVLVSTSLPYDPEVLSAQAQAASARISFKVLCENEEGLSLLPQIREVITNFGFRVSESAENVIRYDYSTEELSLDNPRNKYIRYQINICVYDGRQQQIFSFTDSGREAHFTFQDARERAIRTVSSKITGEFSKKLHNYLESKAMLSN